MTTTVTITGTGCPIPDAERAGPGVLVDVDGLRLQFDAGRSTVQRLAGAGLPYAEVDAVFITHHHSDHLTGLQDLVLTRWVMARGEVRPPLPIVVPAGPAESFVREMLHPWRHDLDVRAAHANRSDPLTLDIVPFDLPDQPTEVWRRGDVRVLAGQVRHEPVHPAVGFRVETPDGVVAITGDTLVCDEVAALAAGADVLVYEAMRFEKIRQRPPHLQFILDYHADTPRIGAQAAELGVPTLVLTHLIPPPESDDDVQAFVDDIRTAGFAGELVVAEDLSQVTLG
jgi:ribonuclease Z